jgi:hypothetical protein
MMSELIKLFTFCTTQEGFFFAIGYHPVRWKWNQRRRRCVTTSIVSIFQGQRFRTKNEGLGIQRRSSSSFLTMEMVEHASGKSSLRMENCNRVLLESVIKTKENSTLQFC